MNPSTRSGVLRPARLALLLALVSTVTACANWQADLNRQVIFGQTVSPSCRDAGTSPADNTRLTGVEQSINEGKYYAALAQLDALGSKAPSAQIARADALRRIERDVEARALYQGLLGSCVDGRAQHGLGLLAAKAGNLDAGLAYLRHARVALPMDARIRNDLGYAMLMAGDWDGAQFEFLTVLDLSPNDPLAGRNLLLLLLRQGKNEKALELAKGLGLAPAMISQLQQQALLLNQPSAKVADNVDKGGSQPSLSTSPLAVVPPASAPSASGVSP